MAVAAVMIVHGLIGYALLSAVAGAPPAALAPVTKLFRIDEPPPPPPVSEPRVRASARPRAQAPPNRAAVPEEIVAPRPVVPLVAPRIVAPPIATEGAAVSAGASSRAGPGTGAGGVGNGLGGGGRGDGDGGTPPQQVAGRLKAADFTRVLGSAAAGVHTVGLRFVVEDDGRVGRCLVTRSSGLSTFDALTCRLIQERFRYRPARDEDDRPVASTVVENHTLDFAPIEEPER